MAFRPGDSVGLRRLNAMLNKMSPAAATSPTLWSALVGNQIPLPLLSRTSTSAGESSIGSQSSAEVARPISPSSSLGAISRHGEGDGIIHLDVGGKEFRTLRSTVSQNRVLSDLVTRAEANPNLLRDGKAVFIDRDPTHFGLILQHLRLKADGVSHCSAPVATKRQKLTSALARRTKAGGTGGGSSVKLPTDKAKLHDVYVEATYFGLEELRDAACFNSFFVFVSRKIFGGTSTDPFDVVSKLVVRLRRVAVALAGLTAGAGTVQSRDVILDALPEGLKKVLLPFLLTSKEEECEAEGALAAAK